ncbi:MAG TPA: lipopolysaccharide assembly protein LapA domain-containing protein [Mycobacterium sp.]|nr:lipopolysaccharide assembly protein LapA domain-containing protein [Mycobacterium sp.]
MSTDSGGPAGQPTSGTGHPGGGRPAHDASAPFTRAAALWSALIAGFLILIVLLAFVAQNPEAVELTFVTWHWTLPLGVAILLAAVGGGLVTVLVGTARIFQLRRAAKKNFAALAAKH